MIEKKGKLYLDINDITNFTHQIIRQMGVDKYKPDIVVAPARGGLIIGTMVSHYFDIPFFGINKPMIGLFENPLEKYKKTLIIDDINDKGRTFKYLEACYTKFFPKNERKYAAIVENYSSEFDKVDYYGTEINKVENDVWVIFPWEDWWKR